MLSKQRGNNQILVHTWLLTKSKKYSTVTVEYFYILKLSDFKSTAMCKALYKLYGISNHMHWQSRDCMEDIMENGSPYRDGQDQEIRYWYLVFSALVCLRQQDMNTNVSILCVSRGMFDVQKVEKAVVGRGITITGDSSMRFPIILVFPVTATLSSWKELDQATHERWKKAKTNIDLTG
ncbi:MAG: hypothetical protein ABH832_01700 [bacterium]